MIGQALDRVDWNLEFLGCNIQDCYNIFCGILLELTEIYVQTSNGRCSRSSKGIPRSLKQHRKSAWNNYKNLRSVHGRTHAVTVDAYETFRAANHQYRNHDTYQRAEQEMFLIGQIKSNPKLFHSYIRRKKKGKPPVGPLKTENGVISDEGLMSEVLAEFFSSVFITVDSQHPVGIGVAHDPIENLHISYERIHNDLISLDPSSSPGPDCIVSRLLKECAVWIAFPLRIICEMSLAEGRLPSQWKESDVAALHKGGSRADVNNYRPVSLTSICCKIMERMVAAHISKYLISNNHLPDHQFGFRPGYSAEDQLLIFYGEVLKHVDEGRIVDVVFLDYSKAFDTVSHAILLQKLWSIGIRGQIWIWNRE